MSDPIETSDVKLEEKQPAASDGDLPKVEHVSEEKPAEPEPVIEENKAEVKEEKKTKKKKEVPLEAVKSSLLPQPPELTAYLNAQAGTPYNKHCIDCLGEAGFSQ